MDTPASSALWALALPGEWKNIRAIQANTILLFGVPTSGLSPATCLLSKALKTMPLTEILAYTGKTN